MSDLGKTVFVSSYLRHTQHGLQSVHSYWRHPPIFASYFFGGGATCHKHGRKPSHHMFGAILLSIGLGLVLLWMSYILWKILGALIQGLKNDFCALIKMKEATWFSGRTSGNGIGDLDALVDGVPENDGTGPELEPA